MNNTKNHDDYVAIFSDEVAYAHPEKSKLKKIIIISPQANMTPKNFRIDFLFVVFSSRLILEQSECILNIIFVRINRSVGLASSAAGNNAISVTKRGG